MLERRGAGPSATAVWNTHSLHPTAAGRALVVSRLMRVKSCLGLCELPGLPTDAYEATDDASSLLLPPLEAFDDTRVASGCGHSTTVRS